MISAVCRVIRKHRETNAISLYLARNA